MPEDADAIIRLADFSGRDGILQGIKTIDEGWILADLSGTHVELPASLEEELRALMGQPTRAVHYFGEYRVASWTRKVPA
jgi:hypothetical protein